MPERVDKEGGGVLWKHTHRELVELLIKHHGIHDGRWSLLVEFGMAIANIGPAHDMRPAALVSLNAIGIQPSPKGLERDNAMTVDAAEVNPKHRTKPQPDRPPERHRRIVRG